MRFGRSKCKSKCKFTKGSRAVARLYKTTKQRGQSRLILTKAWFQFHRRNAFSVDKWMRETGDEYSLPLCYSHGELYSATRCNLVEESLISSSFSHRVARCIILKGILKGETYDLYSLVLSDRYESWYILNFRLLKIIKKDILQTVHSLFYCLFIR